MLSRKVMLGIALASCFVAGCSSFSSKGPDYRSQGGRIPSLEVPPDLTSPVADDRFVIPDAKATTYSAYNRERGAAPATSGSAVLPKIENVRVERSGNQRWLVVRATPDKVWPLVKEFWTESGFVLKRELPESGIMETDWAEDRSKIPQDFVRNTVGKLLDGLYETGFRDKFRTRLETGAEPGTTEIYISHRGVEEVFSNADKASTVWQPRREDRELEAEMLARMVTKLGFTAPDKASMTAAGGSAAASPVRASYDKAKGGPLTVNEPFDRSWRRVGLALDRIGFTVEDRDRSKGVFFVRYIDPDAEAKTGSSKGWLDRLAFWRKDDPAAKPQYRIVVTEVSGNSSVVVQTADAKNDDSATAKRILSLLLEQLK